MRIIHDYGKNNDNVVEVDDNDNQNNNKGDEWYNKDINNRRNNSDWCLLSEHRFPVSFQDSK